MKLSVSLLLLVASISIAVASSSPPPPTPAGEEVRGSGKRNRKCGPRCRRRKERLLGVVLPVDPVQPPGPPENPPAYRHLAGPPQQASGVVRDFVKPREQPGNSSSAFIPAVPSYPSSSLDLPSGPRGPPAPSSNFQGYGPSGPRYVGPPGPRLDVADRILPPPGRGPGTKEVPGPPGVLDIPHLCPGKNQIFVGHNLCICTNGFVMNRNNVCRPLRKRKERL